MFIHRPFCPDGGSAPPPSPLGFDRRDAGGDRQGLPRPVRGRRGAPPFLADGALRRPSRPGARRYRTAARPRPLHAGEQQRSAASSSSKTRRRGIHAVLGARSGRSTLCRRCSARRPRPGPAASTRSTPPISRGSTRSSSPSPMTTASARRIGRRPTSSSPACRAPRRRRPASISPIAATRSPTSRWSRSAAAAQPVPASYHPLVVGLTTNPDRLIQIRRNRLLALNEATETDYVDLEAVNAELAFARRIFADNDWPVIDVTRRSIEETAFAIVKLCNERIDAAEGEAPMRLILASQSAARRHDARAGRGAVRGASSPSSTRRRPRPGLRGAGFDPRGVAEELAQLKALSIAARRAISSSAPTRCSSSRTATCSSKPESREEALDQLLLAERPDPSSSIRRR